MKMVEDANLDPITELLNTVQCSASSQSESEGDLLSRVLKPDSWQAVGNLLFSEQDLLFVPGICALGNK